MVRAFQRPAPRDDGDAHEEGEARRRVALEAARQAGRDGDAGAADAGEERQRLGRTDECSITEVRLLEVSLARADALRRPQDERADHQDEGDDDGRLVEERIDPILEEEPEQGRRDDGQQQHQG